MWLFRSGEKSLKLGWFLSFRAQWALLHDKLNTLFTCFFVLLDQIMFSSLNSSKSYLQVLWEYSDTEIMLLKAYFKFL